MAKIERVEDFKRTTLKTVSLAVENLVHVSCFQYIMRLECAYFCASLIDYSCSHTTSAHPVGHHEACRTRTNNEDIDMVVHSLNGSHCMESI